MGHDPRGKAKQGNASASSKTLPGFGPPETPGGLLLSEVQKALGTGNLRRRVHILNCCKYDCSYEHKYDHQREQRNGNFQHISPETECLFS
jgi:hypothetical protein